MLEDGRARITLGTRQRTHHLFGRFDIAGIDRVHRRYVTPTMLRYAVEHGVRALNASPQHVAKSKLAVLRLHGAQST